MVKQIQKQDAIVSRNDPNTRSAVEARRGIARDTAGKIVFSKEQIKARIAHFKEKIETFADRTKNAKAEIKRLEAML